MSLGETPVTCRAQAFCDPSLPHEHGEEDLPVSDHGVEGAIPLPVADAAAWGLLSMAPSDAEWAEQNRRINDLLAGRSRA